MGITAEKLGAQYKLTRKEVDEFALRSQTRWRLGHFYDIQLKSRFLANNNGSFKNEIVPIKVKSKKGEVSFEVDEHPRDASIEDLTKLKPVFQKDGLVTAGNASGIGDGAAAVVVASEEAVKSHHLQPLVRIVGWQSVGCDPSIMGIGPVDAIRILCKKTNVSLDQVELIDVSPKKLG